MLLIDRGADARVQSRERMAVTPLHSACARARVEVAEALLEAGADPNATQAGGYVPLHTAAASGSRELVDLLLRHGADPERANDAGSPPADVAESRGHAEMAALLRDVSKQTDPEI